MSLDGKGEDKTESLRKHTSTAVAAVFALNLSLMKINDGILVQTDLKGLFLLKYCLINEQEQYFNKISPSGLFVQVYH